MDDEGWEKVKKQKLETVPVVVADDNDANTMDLGDSSSSAKMMDLGDSAAAAAAEEWRLTPWATPWASPPNEVYPPWASTPCSSAAVEEGMVDPWASPLYGGSGWVPESGSVSLPGREDEEEDWEDPDSWVSSAGMQDEEEDWEEKEKDDVTRGTSRGYWDRRTSSSDEDDDWRKQMDGSEILEPLKKAQRASLDMYDRLEKEFKASSQEWKCIDWKKRVDRVRTILKEDPEFRMWEHREYEDLMLVVIYYHTYKSPYHSLRPNRMPENGELVPFPLYLNVHSYDKGRDEQRVAFQKEIEKSDLAKENPDPSFVLSKAQDIAKPFNLLRLKDVKRAVDDYLHEESCKRTLGNIRDLLKQHVLKKNSCREDVSNKILAISEYASPFPLFTFPLFTGVYSLIRSLDSLEDDEALREIDNEYERNLNDVEENKLLFSRAYYLSLKLRFAKEFGF